MVISGNLTGFSHFYASPQAKSLLSEAPFDFDYRNYLTFLNSGEKAYALSFAPSVVAMSVVTRILDSFRRPGVLVVTLLVPRGEQVVLAAGQSKDAAYRLLNDLYERFVERCFVNGMLNQNAAVLMQDYYADIIGRYALAPDGRQRAVNTAINVRTNIKRAGYVQTAENHVPLYLASPWRSSYEGFHHVFLAQHPKDNLIDEQPEEVMLYRVTVSNTGQVIPAARLTDRIPQIMPGEGEKDIASKDFTYQQVLNGEARGIVARLQNENLELTYRFEQEEKTITFQFMFKGKKGKFEALAPRLRFADGREVQLPSEAYTFLGAEINSSITVLISDPSLQVEGGPIELRRLKDGATCMVQLVNRQKIEQRQFQQPTVPSGTVSTTRTGTVPTGGTTQSSTAQTETTVRIDPTVVPTQKNDEKDRSRVIVSSGPTSKPQPNGSYMKVAGILSCVCVAAYLLVASFTQWWPFSQSLSQGGDDPIVTDSAITKNVVVTFVDHSGNPLPSKFVDHKLFDNASMKCFVAPDTAQRNAVFDKDKLAYTYELTGQKDQELVFSVTVDGVNVCSERHRLSEIEDGLVLRLQVEASEIKTYFDKKNWIEKTSANRVKQDYSYVIEQIKNLSSNLREKLTRMLDEKVARATSDEISEPPRTNAPTPEKNGSKSKSKIQNDDLKVKLPNKVLERVSSGKAASIPEGLTQAQKKVLNDYNNKVDQKTLTPYQKEQCTRATTYGELQTAMNAVENIGSITNRVGKRL